MGRSLPGQTVSSRPAVCWLLAGRFLEMAALANNYSFRQYSCLFAFSLIIYIKEKISNGPK